MGDNAQSADVTRHPALAHQWRHVALATVDSTQAEAMRRALAGEPGPLWITAEVQTLGRGRSGRAWSTPAGNLAATLLLRPLCEPVLLPQLSLVAGVAAIDALALCAGAAAGPTALRLKWPNDLMIGAAKLGGILVESSVLGGALVAAIGIGINIAEAPEVAGRAITRLADHTTGAPTPQALLAALAASMAASLEVWSNGSGFAQIRAAWGERALAEGSPITVNAGAGPVSGSFAGLDIDGALLLLAPDGRRRRFTWGDVTLAPVKV